MSLPRSLTRCGGTWGSEGDVIDPLWVGIANVTLILVVMGPLDELDPSVEAPESGSIVFGGGDGWKDGKRLGSDKADQQQWLDWKLATRRIDQRQDMKENDVTLSSYRGKVLLIVNVASKCGLTHSNYKELNVVYEKYKDQGFEILAFPCNQFMSQEPGSNEEIQEVDCTIFKAEFPIFDKIEVNGKNAAPLYKFLKSQQGGILGDAIKWNFTKFLVNKNGKVVDRYAPTTSPLKIEKDIQKLLEA
ncbi:hypothetical protein ZIOFF_041275 [Zingiber officinale]|uniref:Glutathione peroxidase n=1 Tax=Zingiber officinale TaxID=94328 RepID=A0A8J5G4Q3_ZINOF|nr:hypothetical protein ZIOFF_041275 [Zingiber officinale]